MYPVAKYQRRHWSGMALADLCGLPGLKRDTKVNVHILQRPETKVFGFETYMEVDFTSDMRAFGDPSVVPAYFYIDGCAGEGYGFTDILVLLRLLFPRLCKQVPGVSVRFMGAALPHYYNAERCSIPNQA